MKLVIVSVSVAATAAFHPATPVPFGYRGQHLALSALSTADDAKGDLVGVAEGLRAKQGTFLYDSKAKDELAKAVSELEAVAEKPSRDNFEMNFLGDWELICTTATNSPGIDTSKLPFFEMSPLKNIRESLNKSVKVVQKIKSTKNSTTVDRVDNVIEYEPPKSFEEVFGSFPDALSSIPINPLELSKAKVTLIHKAEVACIEPKLKTNIFFESTVLTVAGTSQLLDPAGEDVLSLNLPLAELRAGSFETTYLDDEIRVSRGKQGFVDQLRVFKRIKDDAKVDTLKAELEAAMAEVDYVDSRDDDAPSDAEDADESIDEGTGGDDVSPSD